MKPQINWSDDKDIRRVWAWQAKIGAGPRAGTVSVHWYQNEHAMVNKAICEFAKGGNVKYEKRMPSRYRYLIREIDGMEMPLEYILNYANGGPKAWE